MSRLGRRFVLPTIAELREEEEYLNKGWDDFDHAQGVPLGPQHPMHPTKLVLERRTNTHCVLQSCPQSSWTDSRAKLLEIARKSSLFIPPRFMFVHQSNVYVGSEVAYSTDGRPELTLADIIDSTLPITEIQTAAVLKQASKTLSFGCSVLSPLNICYLVGRWVCVYQGYYEGS